MSLSDGSDVHHYFISVINWEFIAVIDFLDIHSLIFYLKEYFGDWPLSLSSGKETTQLSQIDTASPHLQTEAEFSLQNAVLNRNQDGYVQEVNTYINIPSSQTFESYLHNQDDILFLNIFCRISTYRFCTLM